MQLIVGVAVYDPEVRVGECEQDSETGTFNRPVSMTCSTGFDLMDERERHGCKTTTAIG